MLGAGLGSPGLASVELGAPGLASVELGSPGEAGLGAPGLASVELGSPGEAGTSDFTQAESTLLGSRARCVKFAGEAYCAR